MIKFHGSTDIGQRRRMNQDTYATVSFAPDCALCVVCDGMGGAVGGAEASTLARDTFCREMHTLLDGAFSDGVCSDTAGAAAKRVALCARIPDAMHGAVIAANRAVFAAASADPSLNGMGTTLVALFVCGDYACAVNVGDSRLYVLLRGVLRQLSHDHSYVQYLVDLGKLTREEARASTNRNIITRAVGTAAELEADVIELSPVTGDETFLLCSDGLSGMVSDEEIAAEITAAPAIDAAVDRLIACANAAGGSDNITVVLLHP